MTNANACSAASALVTVVATAPVVTAIWATIAPAPLLSADRERKPAALKTRTETNLEITL